MYASRASAKKPVCFWASLIKKFSIARGSPLTRDVICVGCGLLILSVVNAYDLMTLTLSMLFMYLLFLWGVVFLECFSHVFYVIAHCKNISGKPVTRIASDEYQGDCSDDNCANWCYKSA